MAWTVKCAMFALVLAGSVGCGASEKSVCEGCSGATLDLCKTKYAECEDMSGCNTKDLKDSFADGLCAN